MGLIWPRLVRGQEKRGVCVCERDREEEEEEEEVEGEEVNCSGWRVERGWTEF